MSKKDPTNDTSRTLSLAKAPSAPKSKGDVTLVDVIAKGPSKSAGPPAVATPAVATPSVANVASSTSSISSTKPRKSAPPAVKASKSRTTPPPPAVVSVAPAAPAAPAASVAPSASSRDVSAGAFGVGATRKRASKAPKAMTPTPPPVAVAAKVIGPVADKPVADKPVADKKATLLAGPPSGPVASVASVASVAPVASSRRTGDQTLFGQPSSVPANVSNMGGTSPSSKTKAAASHDSIAFDKTIAVSGKVIAVKPEDEISIPPASDLEEHDHFFKEGELAEKEAREQARAQALRPNGPITGDHEALDPRLLQLASPAARARRAKYAKLVKLAVGISAVLCLAAAVRVAVARSSGEAETSALAAQTDAHPIHAEPQAPAQPVIAAQPAAPAPQDPIAQQAPVAPAQAATPAPQAATPETTSAPVIVPDPSQAPAAQPASAQSGAESAAAPAVSDKTAPEEKKAARIALERGKAKDAIAAGERSVELDPTDGEAWLILGAAYQEAGKPGEARRCFNACLKQGKKGPIGECRSMLQ